MEGKPFNMEPQNQSIVAKFESASYKVATAPQTLSSFLAVPANLYEILPQDRIEGWKSDDTGCSFKIKGLAQISLKLDTADRASVVYVSASEKPFSFFLRIYTQPSDDQTTLNAEFEADVNAMMGMMLKTPLTNFLNSLGEAIQRKYAAA